MRKFVVNVNGTSYEVQVEEITGAAASAAPAPVAAPAAPVSAGAESVCAPMPGTILSVDVSAGQMVESGAVMFVLEAMKMENEILAPKSGKVVSVSTSKGAAVNSGDVLAVIE
jgi:biotin carboxyl carrier protein